MDWLVIIAALLINYVGELHKLSEPVALAHAALSKVTISENKFSE